MIKMEKRVIIVGATSGIGLEVARIYLGRGYTLGLAGRRIDRLEEIRRKDPSHVFIKRIDVTSDDAAGCLRELIDDVGGMDLYIHCSGVGSQNMLLDWDIERNTISTNASGFARMVLAAYRYFADNGIMGQIAVISSIAGTKGLGAAPSYSATKRFQNTYIDSLAQLSRMRGDNISFTDIRPGFIRTDLLKDGRHYPMLMSVEYASRLITKAIDRRKRSKIIDWRYEILVFLWRLIPEWLWERLPIRN